MTTKLPLFMFAGLLAGACGNGPNGDDVVTGDDAPPFFDGVSTLSGHAEVGFVDGKRGVARFANPVNVAFAPGGTVFVADFDNGKIRAVDAETGMTSTTISIQGFSRPFGMAVAPDGTLFVSTDRNSTGGGQMGMTGTIWRIDADAQTAEVIAENIGRPRGLAVMANGRLAIADYQHHVIQIVDPATGQVTPLAGAWDAPGMVDGVGSAARFAEPYGIVARGDELLVADFGNHRVRRVGLDGSVSTLAGVSAGFGDGAMSAARFNGPQGLAIADNGDVFVSDLENYRIRKITATGVVTVAGSGQGGYLDHDDPLQAELYGLEGIAVTPDGSALFVADGGRGENLPHNFIRIVHLK